MGELIGISLTTFFATIAPLNVAAVYTVLTAKANSQQRRKMAIRGTFISLLILMTFALIGELVLNSLGISMAALRTAGGVLLLLISIDLAFARPSGGISTTDEEAEEAVGKSDISVFPIATPLIAGPGAIGATILLMANAGGDIAHQAVIIASLLVILLLTLIAMLMAEKLHSLLGVTGMQVISRVMGILLAALAVQFMFDGIKQSGLMIS